jgi:hypothetical protein
MAGGRARKRSVDFGGDIAAAGISAVARINDARLAPGQIKVRPSTGKMKMVPVIEIPII